MTRNDAQTNPWKTTKASDRVDGEGVHRETEHEGLIGVEIARDGLEMDPAPHQGKGDQRRDDAAPHDQPVGQAAQAAAPKDELVRGERRERIAGALRSRFVPMKRGVANTCHPRRQYIRVGGRCSHIAYR